MAGQVLGKEDYARISRMVFLLLNRTMMYKADHPHIKEAVRNLHQELTGLKPGFSSLALMLNRDQLFLDDEPIDPRINVGRIVALFKKTGVKSISFIAGIAVEELQALIDILTALHKYPDSDKMTEELTFRGVQHLKINHVYYKKITKDDEIVSRGSRQETDSPASPPAGAGPELSQEFLKTLLESALTEEAEKALTIKNLLDDPQGLSQSMLETEARSRQAMGEGGLPPSGSESDSAGDMRQLASGAALLYQIQTLSEDVHQKIEAGEQADMMEVADAVFEMKRQLTLGIEAQKALNQAYANEEQLLDQMNELTDGVLIKLIKNEYQQGKITTARLAQILRRLVPQPGELKRLLPKIKAALLAEGMPLAEYLQLVRHLGKELESEGLAYILQEAAESVGVDGDELIDEIRKKPERAAELMAIAAEIRKGTGDDDAFMEVLIDYVERLGAEMKKEAAATDEAGAQARQALSAVGSGLISQLKNMNFSGQALAGLEERINARLEAVFAKLTTEPSAPFHPQPVEPARPAITLLQMMEQTVGNDEALKDALREIRLAVDDGRIDGNHFGQIHAGLMEYEKTRQQQELNRQIPPGVLREAALRLHLGRELFRSKRHNLPLSTLSYILVNVRAQDKLPADMKIKKTDLLDATFQRLIGIIRASDIIGELNQDVITIILPMTDKDQAGLALRRLHKPLHEHPFEINGVPLSVVLAGAVSSFQTDMRPNVDSFIKTISYELEHVAMRIKNVHKLA